MVMSPPVTSLCCLFQCPTILIVRKVFLTLFCWSLNSVSYPAFCDRREKCGSIFLYCSFFFQTFENCWRVLRPFPLLQIKHTFLHTAPFSNTFIIFVVHMWTISHFSTFSWKYCIEVKLMGAGGGGVFLTLEETEHNILFEIQFW